MYIVVGILTMREAKKPDLTAPRYRATITHVCSQKLYKDFRRKFPQYKNYSDTVLRQILDTLHGKIWKEVLDTRDGVELFEKLGYIFLGTCPSPKKNNINQPLSLEVGQQVKHRNFESDNFLAKIFYTNFGKYQFHNREVWMFTAIRDFKRSVPEVYRENWKRYLQVDNYTRVSRIFRKKNTRLWAIQNIQDVPADYNEFAID